MTNSDRSFRAGNALELYDVGLEEETAVVDLLSDIRHYCQEHEIDFENCNRLARWHYEKEVENAYSLETCEV